MKSIMHLKKPKINGKRENVYFDTHTDCVENLTNVIEDSISTHNADPDAHQFIQNK